MAHIISQREICELPQCCSTMQLASKFPKFSEQAFLDSLNTADLEVTTDALNAACPMVGATECLVSNAQCALLALYIPDELPRNLFLLLVGLEPAVFFVGKPVLFEHLKSCLVDCRRPWTSDKHAAFGCVMKASAASVARSICYFGTLFPLPVHCYEHGPRAGLLFGLCRLPGFARSL